MSNDTPELPEPLWRAVMGGCVVARYDFSGRQDSQPVDAPGLVVIFPNISEA